MITGEELFEMIQLKLTEKEPETETEEVKGKKKEKGIKKIKLKVENLKLGDIIISHDDVFVEMNCFYLNEKV